MIDLLIIDSFHFSWYRKYIGKKLKVYKEKVEQFPGKMVYQHVDSDGIIDSKHGLTIIQQRSKKIERLK